MTITKQETCSHCGAQIRIEMDDQAGKKFLAMADQQIEKFKKIHGKCCKNVQKTKP